MFYGNMWNVPMHLFGHFKTFIKAKAYCRNKTTWNKNITNGFATCYNYTKSIWIPKNPKSSLIAVICVQTMSTYSHPNVKFLMRHLQICTFRHYTRQLPYISFAITYPHPFMFTKKIWSVKLSCREYKGWKQLLHINATLGCGKTVMQASVRFYVIFLHIIAGI